MAKPMAFTVQLTGSIRYEARELIERPLPVWQYSISSAGDTLSRLHLVSAALDVLLACTPDELVQAERMIESKRAAAGYQAVADQYLAAAANVKYGETDRG